MSPDLVPGFTPACWALAGFVLPHAPVAQVREIVASVLGVATPHIKAEALADLSDSLIELAEQFPHDADAFLFLARHLDEASHDIRQHLEGNPR